MRKENHNLRGSKNTYFPNRDKKPSDKFDTDLKIRDDTKKQILYHPQVIKQQNMYSRIVSSKKRKSLLAELEEHDTTLPSQDEMMQADALNEFDQTLPSQDEITSEITSEADPENIEFDQTLPAQDEMMQAEAEIGPDDESGLQKLENIESEEVLEDIPSPLDAETGLDEVSVIDAEGIDESISSDDLEIALMGDTLFVLSNNKTLAYMNKVVAAKSDKADIYTAHTFPHAVAVEIETSGLRKGLELLGFKLTTIKLDNRKALQAAVTKHTQKIKADAEKKAQEFTDNMAEALAIAAIGMNRGFFKGYDNVLKAAMITEMQNMGVTNAQKVVNRVFAENADGYTHTLVTLASEVAQEPADIRQRIVATLDRINAELDLGAEEVESNEVEAEDTIPASIEAALRAPLRTTVTANRKSDIDLAVRNFFDN